MTVNVTVILPLFTAEHTVRAAVEKLLRQHDVTLEIVLVDDGSPDATSDVAAQLAAEHPSVRFVPLTENAGVAAARERGVAESTGEFIWMIDDDDDWADDALQTMVSAARRSGADVVVAGAQYIYSTGAAPRPVGDADLAGEFSNDEAFRLFMNGRISGHLWNKLFARDLVSRIEFTRTAVHSDHAMVAQLLALCTRVAATPEPVYRYQVRSGSLVRSGKKRGESLAKVHAVVTAAANTMRPPLTNTNDFMYYHHRYVISSALKDAVSGAYRLDEEKLLFSQFRRQIRMRGIVQVARRRDVRRLLLLTTPFLGRPLFHRVFSGR